MPTYDFKCNDTGKHFQVSFKTYDAYEQATIKSPFTGTPNVTRIIRRVAIGKSESTRWDGLQHGDMQALRELEQSDPETLGRALRHLGDQSGEDLGEEFNYIVEELETGKSPEEIEAQMPDQDDGRWMEGLGSGIPGTDSYAPDAPEPAGLDD